MIKSEKDTKKLQKRIPKASRVVLDFQKVVRPNSARLPAVTPYAKEEMDLVEKKNRSSREYREAMEEFFAESFAVWKWYPKWLEKHRKAIHDFFAANKHLRSAAGPKRP